MKKLLTTLFVILIISIAFGQEHRTNDYGILFGIGDDFLSPPESIMENGIGAMIYLDNFALRPTLQFGTTKQDNGAETSASIFGLGAALIKHLNENRVAPYYGAGLSFSSAKEDNSTERSASTFSIYGLLGVDFYITKNVSLGAEYNAGLHKTSSKIEYSSGTDVESSSTSFGFDTVKVILTIFFM
ncbi:MAG: outer membrane beta-barrel protein [bacterium]